MHKKRGLDVSNPLLYASQMHTRFMYSIQQIAIRFNSLRCKE